jgi:CO dehydrogenase nickel-insertion accessory protein CooC1
MLFHTETLYESNAPILMANLLRCFGQGIKVAFEIVMMATDAGLCTLGEEVIAMAGTARGCDTALVVHAASSRDMKKLRINEILCKQLDPLNIDELRERLTKEQKAPGGERKDDAPETPEPMSDRRRGSKS